MSENAGFCPKRNNDDSSQHIVFGFVGFNRSDSFSTGKYVISLAEIKMHTYSIHRTFGAPSGKLT